MSIASSRSREIFSSAADQTAIAPLLEARPRRSLSRFGGRATRCLSGRRRFVPWRRYSDQDSAGGLGWAAQCDQSACLREVNGCISQGCRAQSVKAETDELVEAPAAEGELLGGPVIGGNPIVLGLVHRASGSVKRAGSSMGWSAHCGRSTVPSFQPRSHRWTEAETATPCESGKAHAIAAGLAVCGPGYSSSFAAAARGVSQARQIRAPAGPTTALAPQNGHSPRSSSENQERASTSGGSRLTLARLGRRVSHGIGRKTYPTLSRVLLKLGARAASLLRIRPVASASADCGLSQRSRKSDSRRLLMPMRSR